MIDLFNGTSSPARISQLKVIGMRGVDSIVSMPKVDLELKPAEWNGTVGQRRTTGITSKIPKMNMNVSKKLE
jgi:hypothetical protein